MENPKHYLAGVGAFVIWGFFSVPLRALKAFSAGEILYFRILFSVLFLSIILFSFRKASLKKDWAYFRSMSGSKKWKVLGLTLAGGLLLTINWLVFIYTVNYVNVKTASFSYLICPVMTAALGYVIIKEKLEPLQWIAVGLCALSCALIGMSSFQELGYSVVTALSFALYLISQRKNQEFDRLFVLGVQMLFALLVLSFGINHLVGHVPASGLFYEIIILIAIGFTIIPLFLNLFALQQVNSATIGILMYINPMLNFVLAFTLFDEQVDLTQLLGYVIIFIGLFLFNYQNIRKLQGKWVGVKRTTSH
ncbi:EamA family transporter [Rapidithrix thailandica]|uniref:EamA family transporter n=1 Tax=Rapidithrix thailandica TaxID=413964 RepID=A0AAW9S5S5_9BACT